MPGVAVVCLHLFAGELAARQLDALLAAAEIAYADVSGQYSGVHTTADGAAALDGNFTLSARCGSAATAIAPGWSARRLTLTNPRYAAELQITADGWALIGLAAPQPPEFPPALAMCGVVGEGTSHRQLLAGRAGPAAVTATRAGHTLAFPAGGRRVEFDIAQGLVTAYRLTDARGGVTACDILSAGGDPWPGLQRVVVEYLPGQDGPRHAYRTEVAFLRYARLTTPPPAERFQLASAGLPEPETVPATPERYPLPPDPNDPGSADPADGRWLGWAVGGILAVGAAAFLLVGRQRPAAAAR